MNPQELRSNSVNISVKTMYQYDNHTNIPWNMTQYSPVKEYLDPQNQITQRKYSTQKKGQKTNLYVTKRGFYMDYDLKVAKSIPSASHYKSTDNWDYSKEKAKALKIKIDKKLIKYSFLEQIEIQQKNRKKPGIATYNLIKTNEQIEADKKKMRQKKRSEGAKRFFYQNTELLADGVPGSGAHNPRQIRHKLHLNKTDRSFWISKHSKQADVLKKRYSLVPGAATYQAVPVTYPTFQKTFNTSKEKKQKRNWFGSDQKFEYLREAKVKDKIKQIRPTPATYNTHIQWPTKFEKQGEEGKHKKNWFNRISHGYTAGVYH